MFTSDRSFTQTVQPPVAAAHAVTALAAAVLVVAAVWPQRAIAQHDAAVSPSPTASSQQSMSLGATGDADDADLPAATRRARADEQRLFGSPGATFDPYASDRASPAAQHDALMSEQRMKIVRPSDFYRSGSPANDAGGVGRGKRRGGSASASDGGGVSTGIGTRAGDAVSGTNGAAGTAGAQTPYSGSASTAGPTIYRDPYQSQSAYSGQTYRMPW